MILENFTSFLDEFFEKLDTLKIDISKYELDHMKVKFHYEPVLEIAKREKGK